MQKFPFPGEPNSNGSSPDAAPSIGGAPQAPDASGAPGAPAPAGKPDATKQFPFPGEASQPDSSAGEKGTSSSSSSSGDDASPVDSGASPGGTPGLKDKGSEGSTATPGRHILHRVNPVGTKLQTTDEREAEDLSVAHFYTQTGDLQGAYLRSQDAVKTAPDDPDAHFALAEIALKLNKRDEAIAEYNACLKLDPSDKQAKDANKALEHLKP
jgi:tetratricopeptide (TPR) repeat protein